MSVKPEAVAALLLTFCLTIPMASAAEDEAALGHKIFQRETCEGCHPGGDNTLDPGHPIKGDKFQTKYKDDALLEQVIRHGFPDSGMPQFSKTAITDKEMKQLIAYIRSLTPKKTK